MTGFKTKFIPLGRISSASYQHETDKIHLWFHPQMGEFPPRPFTPQGASRFLRTLLQCRCCCKRSRRASRSCISNNPPGNSAAGLRTLSSKSFYHAEKVCSLAEWSAYPGEERGRGEVPTVCQLLCWAPPPQAIGTSVHTSWSTGALPFNDEATWPKASFPLRKRRGNESLCQVQNADYPNHSSERHL